MQFVFHGKGDVPMLIAICISALQHCIRQVITFIAAVALRPGSYVGRPTSVSPEILQLHHTSAPHV